jgi:hypothetical protein
MNINDSISDSIINFLSKFGISHIPVDEDGFYNGLVMPKLHANYLFCTSFMSFASGLYALYNKQYNFAIFPLGVFIASINYWIHPINDWRRYIDMLYAAFAIISQSFYAFDHPNFKPYLFTMIIGTVFYPLSFYFQHTYLPLSTLCHSLIHIVANIANFILYTNTIDTSV